MPNNYGIGGFLLPAEFFSAKRQEVVLFRDSLTTQTEEKKHRVRSFRYVAFCLLSTVNEHI